jgi:hypothetical protein
MLKYLPKIWPLLAQDMARAFKYKNTRDTDGTRIAKDSGDGSERNRSDVSADDFGA